MPQTAGVTEIPTPGEHRPPGPAQVVMARAVAALAAMTLVMLLVAAVGRWLLPAAPALLRADEDLVAAAAQVAADHPALLDVLLAWAWITRPGILFALLAALALGLHVTGRTGPEVWWLVAVGLLGWGLEVLCKLLVVRPRPEEALSTVGGHSYPSGHATGAALAMVLLVVMLLPVVRGRVGRGLLVGGAGLVVVLTCLDRVYLGVHHPSDVVAGVVLGVGMVAVACPLLRLGGQSRRA